MAVEYLNDPVRNMFQTSMVCLSTYMLLPHVAPIVVKAYRKVQAFLRKVQLTGRKSSSGPSKSTSKASSVFKSASGCENCAVAFLLRRATRVAGERGSVTLDLVGERPSETLDEPCVSA